MLLTDNGAPMLAAETREGLERLGIAHVTTLPYSPEQNAIQEGGDRCRSAIVSVPV